MNSSEMDLPSVEVTPRAIEALKSFHRSDEPQTLRIELMEDGSHGLAFAPKKESDIELSIEDLAPYSIIFDSDSLKRAAGLKVDFIDNGEQSGFRLDRSDIHPPDEPEELDAACVIANIEAQEPPSISMTDSAYAMFSQAIEEEGGASDFGILVRARRMGATSCNYELDVMRKSEMPQDLFEIVLRDISLFVDKMSALHLKETEVDFIEEDERAGFKFHNPAIDAGWSDARALELENLIEHEINPGLAAHGGYVRLLDLQGNAAFVLMGGGCQGCGMASITLQQGVKKRVKEAIPSIEHIIDTTDHAAGKNPYFQRTS